MLLQAGLAFGQAPSDSVSFPPDSTKSIASCWVKVSKLGRGKEITLYDRDTIKYKGDIERVRDDPSLLSVKVYDASQSRFIIHEFSSERIRRIEYQSTDVTPRLFAVFVFGMVGALLGSDHEGLTDEISVKHPVLAGAFSGAVVGWVFGTAFSPSKKHVIECP